MKDRMILVCENHRRSLLSKLLFALSLSAMATRSAYAGYSCSGVLTDAQQEGFDHFFAATYSPSLILIGSTVGPDNMFKQLSATDLQSLSAKQPKTAVQTTLTDLQASTLRGWLNDNSGSQIPGWVSTAIGALVPGAWVGLGADVFIQIVNANGDNGRKSAANIAGTVSAGGRVGVLEQVSKTGGKNKYVWAYVYQATLNGKVISMPLAACSADIVSQ